ncbi:hypothetical protein K7X08_025621 [Anisodus acutangulus]|uniref:Uncharacterized protein n=1 Tax=Anisodus acutangulus TaxID=402998 RepID=A0A9Q1LUD8_9SOLA|nr:hypothetical protein K7X08_025621 [Anisodus acutangulus]
MKRNHQLKKSTPEGEPAAKRGRGRPMTRSNTTPSVATEIPAHHDTGNWFSCPAPNTTPSMAPQMPSTVAGRSSRTRRVWEGMLIIHLKVGLHVLVQLLHLIQLLYLVHNQDLVQLLQIKKREKVWQEQTPYKRPRVMGMGVFQAENGVTTINPNQRIVSTGSRKMIRSADVSGDIGFKPTSGLKWKGSKAITTRRLQEIRDQAKTNASNNASQCITPSTTNRFRIFIKAFNTF